MTGCAAVPVAETFVENSFVALLRLKICASLRKLLSTESDFSRQDAKPQSSEIFPFLFAPLREIFPTLVAATPHRILRAPGGERFLISLHEHEHDHNAGLPSAC